MGKSSLEERIQWEACQNLMRRIGDNILNSNNDGEFHLEAVRKKEI